MKGEHEGEYRVKEEEKAEGGVNVREVSRVK